MCVLPQFVGCVARWGRNRKCLRLKPQPQVLITVERRPKAASEHTDMILLKVFQPEGTVYYLLLCHSPASRSLPRVVVCRYYEAGADLISPAATSRARHAPNRNPIQRQ